MTSRSVLRCLTPRLPTLSVGSVFRSMPLGRITGRPVTSLSLAISARRSATACFNSAFSASRRSVRASRSPRDSPQRGIFSGTDMPGTNRVRKERMQPHSISYLPGFLPQVPERLVCRIHRVLLSPVVLRMQPPDPIPLLRPHYSAFVAPTDRSAPVLRIGTLASWLSPLVLLP